MASKRKISKISVEDSIMDESILSRKLSEKNKQLIILKQGGKCANTPDNPAVGLRNYHCLLWMCYGGYFDESNYEFDHKVEFSKGGDTSNDNIQALCPNCHSVKTRRFMKQKGEKFSSDELDMGRAHMVIDSEQPKKKSRTSRKN